MALREDPPDQRVVIDMGANPVQEITEAETSKRCDADV
jgi:hypothetical protein